MFFFGAVIMILCALTQLCLRRNKFSKYYLKPFAGYKKTMDATPTPALRRESCDQEEDESAMLNKSGNTHDRSTGNAD